MLTWTSVRSGAYETVFGKLPRKPGQYKLDEPGLYKLDDASQLELLEETPERSHGVEVVMATDVHVVRRPGWSIPPPAPPPAQEMDLMHPVGCHY